MKNDFFIAFEYDFIYLDPWQYGYTLIAFTSFPCLKCNSFFTQYFSTPSLYRRGFDTFYT